MRIYPGKISYALPTLLFTVIISFLVMLGTKPDIFVLLLLAPFVLLSLMALGYKLEVHKDFIRSSFLGITLYKIYPYMVESITYGNIGFWNSIHPTAVTYGKGLAILIYRNGMKKTVGISEKLYGKKAIQDVKSFLIEGKVSI